MPWGAISQTRRHLALPSSDSRRRLMYPHRTAYTIAIFVVCAFVIFFALQKGAHNRVMLAEHKTVTIQTPDQAYNVWQNNGVKGRILILFDSYPHMKGLRNYNGSLNLTQWNLVEFSVLKNIVRKIYLVTPENEWEELLLHKEKRPIRDVLGLTRGVYLSTMSGIPFIATTPSSLGHISEEVLVYLNEGLFDPVQVIDLLNQNTIRSDIMIICRGKR